MAGEKKLLIITQKVDINDDLLGFFHRWIEEFAKHFEKVVVVCLQKGEYNLPQNVKVLSLGKEQGRSRLKYLFNFYKYIFQERKNYDLVFVHMNQEYVILGGLFWKILNKKIFMWRNHPRGNFLTNIAVFLSDRVFCTSKYSYTAKFKKTEIMPAGIDTETFKRYENIQRIPNSILYLGRISPIKNVDILIEAVKLLDKEGIDFVLNIVGEPGEKDKEYFEKIKNLSKDLEQKGKIKFLGRIPNYRAPEIYNQNEIFVNLTPSGSYDKTILEAMACGCIVLISNKSLFGQINENLFFPEKDAKDLAIRLEEILSLDTLTKENIIKSLHNFVIEKHGLTSLIQKILKK
jgi:glycosyltransferase involved in cell wall biosynthesis